MPKGKPAKRDGASADRIKDSRFASFETDPRYQLPSKKNLKTKLDKRFSRVLKDADFVATAKVDRYGRKLKTDTKKKALERLYEDEDEGKDDQDQDGQDVDADAEVEDDDIVRRELEKADASYDPARGGGFSSSESDADSEDESESEPEPEADEVEESRPGIRLRREKQEVEVGEVTNRLAVVNMDWDHIKSTDLMSLFSSFVPVGGRIEKVSIFPSEFGKGRMQREEVEGPPREIFKKAKDEDDDEDDDEDSGFGSEDDDEDAAEDSDEEAKNELLQEGNAEEFDNDALRTYQLDRLRYYYAVVLCSDKNTAHKIYDATDGSEYLSSSNFLDLRFIPDDVTFDDESRDECDSVPSGYKPIEFVTDALQHSKVKLTWDMHPDEVSRKETINKAFTGSRSDIAENDLRAYLASDSESEEEEEDEEASPENQDAEEAPLSKKELARRKMRAALGLGDEPAPKASKSGPVGGMEITFAPALSGKPEKEETEETTIEKYKRKEKERKEQKRAKSLAKREGVEPDVDTVEEERVEEATEDLGFNDPFFTSEPVQSSKSAVRKEERLKKRAAKEKEDAENAAQKAQLELLMADENGGGAHLDHFDMKEIVRAEKQKSKKKKKGKKGAAEDQGGLQEEFNMDVQDSRFKAVFENHEFAIDPSNPKYKATDGMKKLLEEGRKKRKAGPNDSPNDKKTQRSSKKAKADGDFGELSSLVDAVKKKAKARR
ncbi:Pre-rRNA-processing protein esf1 [Chaetomidium leptoderma]|uniref:Pre-rRNA-processing protein esf1 n=1 Tax=Chaetomidium leptoderma TaxID=669021 RepID=A0AAN6ZW15_9PEZI|nr:Pre-rRNA-processing protein esf1 [Chaetomidium leptoderma]